jgi:hypothetical protein
MMGKKVNLNDIARRQRAEAEQERARAEAERIAAIEERFLKRALSDAMDVWSLSGRWRYRNALPPRPHPNNAGHRPITSPAGAAADKGRKWGGCLPGSFETGKRR